MHSNHGEIKMSNYPEIINVVEYNLLSEEDKRLYSEHKIFGFNEDMAYADSFNIEIITYIKKDVLREFIPDVNKIHEDELRLIERIAPIIILMKNEVQNKGLLKIKKGNKTTLLKNIKNIHMLYEKTNSTKLNEVINRLSSISKYLPEIDQFSSAEKSLIKMANENIEFECIIPRHIGILLKCNHMLSQVYKKNYLSISLDAFSIMHIFMRYYSKDINKYMKDVSLVARARKHADDARKKNGKKRRVDWGKEIDGYYKVGLDINNHNEKSAKHYAYSIFKDKHSNDAKDDNIDVPPGRTSDTLKKYHDEFLVQK
jgi:hypothetical protein